MFVSGSFPFEEAVMRFQGAVLKERGVTFAIVKVREHVLENSFEADTTRRRFERVFPGLPVVLFAETLEGKASYDGRADLVEFLYAVPVNYISLKEYIIS